MINFVYEAVCDGCTMHIDYVAGCQNKEELATELQARGYVVKGKCTEVYHDVVCEGIGK